LFFALDIKNVVVDVEKIIERRGDEIFYRQRCAKECVVKWLQLPLDETETMII